MELVEERFGASGLSEISKDAIDARLGGAGEAGDELGRLAAELTPEWVHELCDGLRACGSADACMPEVNVRCSVGERELVALVLALQARGGAFGLPAFRLHVATCARARLHALVVVGFVRLCRALNLADVDANALAPTNALVSLLREVHDALADGAALSVDGAQSVVEAACELLRSGQLKGASSTAAFDVLACLLPDHAQTVFQALVPMLALAVEGGRAAARDASELQKHTAQFACAALALGDDERVLNGTQALVQHAMTSAPDRTESRGAVSRAACSIIGVMPPDHVVRYAAFVGRLARNAKPQLRLMACDAVVEALACDALAPTDEHRLLKLLLVGTRDKSTTVRARAVGALGTVIERFAAAPGGRLAGLEAAATAAAAPAAASLSSAAAGCPAASPIALAPTAATEEEESEATLMSVDGTPTLAVVPAFAAASDAEANPANSALRRALASRCRDAKPVVRRLAVGALSALALAAADGAADAEAAQMLSDRCRDTSLAVRKASASALGALFEKAAAKGTAQAAVAVGRAWLASVAPLVTDVETTVRESVAQALGSSLIEPIARGPAARAALCWRVLGGCDRAASEQVRRALGRMALAGAVPKGLAKALQAALAARGAGTEPLTPAARTAAWALLEELAASKAHAKEIKADALVCAWAEPTAGASPSPAGGGGGGAAEDADALGALNVLVQLSKLGLLPAGASGALLPRLRALLLGGAASPALSRAVAHAYAAANAAVGVPAGQAWAEVIERCEMAICAHVSARGRATADGSDELGCTPALSSGAQAVEDVLARVFLAGEVGLLCEGQERASDPLPERLVRALEAEAVHAASGRASAASPAAAADAESVALQAQAVVALGKLCGSRAWLAKRLVPMLVTELHESASPAVRNNCLFVLADLLTQYTALVDRHVPLLALAMADEQPLVRYHGVVLVTRLLLADFVRWKPLVLRAFALALADGEARVREMAEHCLVQQLLPRQPQLLGAHIVEIVAALNGCTAHLAYAPTSALSAAQEARLQLAGAANRPRRAAIYATLARAMCDEVRLTVFQKLTAEVLGAAADGSLGLHERGAGEMLADALDLASSGALKVASGRGGAAGADADEEEPAPTAAGAKAATARTKLVTAAAYKLTAESALPIAIELRRALEAARSPLLGNLFAFVREQARDSKELLAELGARDRAFGLEIEFELGSRGAAARAPPAAELVAEQTEPVAAQAALGAGARPSQRPARNSTVEVLEEQSFNSQPAASQSQARSSKAVAPTAAKRARKAPRGSQRQNQVPTE
ncbi:non-SMC mitotic condensation complex subunit 1-domain-containing protein [Pavlovales sp. CCMP2436]|nr:non-SMC mitotic condensation complex subunit 1-domain-containing protein [Pavlovales sp. CCMP2436]